MVKEAYKAASEFKVIDPLILDLSKISSFTDFFFICSVSSPLQMKAVAEGIIDHLKTFGVRHFGHTEGAWDNSWVLLDYGDFIVHIFQEEARNFYNLEQLWSRAEKIELEGGTESAAGGLG